MLNRDDDCVHTHWKHGTTVLAVLDGNLKIMWKYIMSWIPPTKRGLIVENYSGYNNPTCVFESGRSHGRVPLRRSSAILAFSLWARTIVRGMHSSVSSVAYPNIRPCERCSAKSQHEYRSKYHHKTLSAPHVWQQWPKLWIKHKWMNPSTWSPAPTSSSFRSRWTPWAMSCDCCSRATSTLQVL